MEKMEQRMEQSEIRTCGDKIYDISVVIPVYNGENYLHECVDSILAQTFLKMGSVEILMVDDGSKDSSGNICDEYAAKHEFIHVVHKQNEGINQTRRYGVRVARGEWIAFSDQDDSMPVDALQSMWDKHEDTDIVIGFPDKPIHRKDLSLDECRSNAITSKLFPPTPWAKLYRKALFSDDIFDFPRGIDGEEDMIMNIRLMFKIDRAPHFVFKKVYNFRRNTASVSHTKKASLGHEVLFHNVRATSMPNWAQEKFLRETIFSRLNGLTGVGHSDPKALCDKNTPFIKQLRNDIERSHYKMDLQEWLLLNIRNEWLYKRVSFLIMVKNFLKYHLGLNN